MRSIALVRNLLVLALVFTHCVFDSALDVVLRHILAFAGSDDSTQTRVVLGLRATSFHSDGNLLAEFRKCAGHVTPSLQLCSLAVFKCSSHWIISIILFILNRNY